MKVKCKCGNDKFFLEKHKEKHRNQNTDWVETVGSLICTKCEKTQSKWSE